MLTKLARTQAAISMTTMRALHSACGRCSGSGVASAVVGGGAAPSFVSLTMQRYPPSFFPMVVPAVRDDRTQPFLTRAPLPHDRPCVAHGSLLVRRPAMRDGEEGSDRRSFLVRVTKYPAPAAAISLASSSSSAAASSVASASAAATSVPSNTCFVVALDDPVSVLCRELSAHLSPSPSSPLSSSSSNTLTLALDTAPFFLRALGIHRLRSLGDNAPVRSLLARGQVHVLGAPALGSSNGSSSLVLNSSLGVLLGEPGFLRSHLKMVALLGALLLTVASHVYIAYKDELKHRQATLQEQRNRQKELEQAAVVPTQTS